MKYVLLYESADDLRTKARPLFPAHRARWQDFRAQGTLLMIGTYADLSGAMAIFTTREAAEAFAKDDPLVVNGVVRNWFIREWNEALAGP